MSNPLGVTRAYATRFTALNGDTLIGDARSLRRTGRPSRLTISMTVFLESPTLRPIRR